MASTQIAAWLALGLTFIWRSDDANRVAMVLLFIGTVARCSPKAVETRIYRARQILKAQLKDLRS